MAKHMTCERITVDPNQMGGVPCVRGLRIPVATVVQMVAAGISEEEILRAYPDLEHEDIREALECARTGGKAMETRDNPEMLSADRPITRPEDDRLGYAGFARHLAEAIRKMVPSDGLVLAIYGAWGSGKTTLLNLVAHYLAAPSDEPPFVIVRFNPWWFSGHEDLVHRFFDQLVAVLGNRGCSMANLRRRIADFADLVSDVPLPYASTGRVVARMARPKPRDVPELKEAIARDLRERGERIVVLVDDIDRLTGEEIRQLFRAIKAVADFPNVVYLLAFEKAAVAGALADAQPGISGDAYLEKIVQVPFELLLPDRAALRRLLFGKLDGILGETEAETFDARYWTNVYLTGVDHFIATPRAVVRLSNALSVTYPAVKGEVNPVDFVAIETVRVFLPDVYDVVRRGSHMFAGHSEYDGYSGSAVEQLKAFHERWMDQVADEDRDAAKKLLTRIFPKLEVVWGNTRYGANSEPGWRKKRRVCSPDVFDVYFRLAVPEGQVSRAEFSSTLALANDADAFGRRLVELSAQKRPDGTSKARAFLDQLADYTGADIAGECIPSIVQALFEVGDKLLIPGDERDEMVDFGNDMRIMWVLLPLLARLDPRRRAEVLRGAIEKGSALATIVHLVSSAISREQVQEEGSKDGHGALVVGDDMEELRRLASDKVRAASQDGTLLTVPDLAYVLYRWREWCGEEEVRQWVARTVSADEGLLLLLRAFLGRHVTQGMSDVMATVSRTLDSKSLEPFLDPSAIIGRVRILTEREDIADDQRVACTQFVRSYDLRQRGVDPDSARAEFEE